MTSSQISPASSKISEEIQKLEPSAVIELFELKLTTAVNGIDSTFYYHAGTNGISSNIVFNNQTYSAVPAEVNGFDKTTKGTLPRPSFTVANANNAITNILLLYNLLNAEVKRIKTCKKFIDAMRWYHRKWIDKLKTYSKPVHDWSSNYSQAWRTASIAIRDLDFNNTVPPQQYAAGLNYNPLGDN